MHRSSLLGVVVLGIALGCGSPPPEDPELAASVAARDDRSQGVDVAEVIRAWLECTECEAGQLEGVVELRDTAVPFLVIVLEDGPSMARLEIERRKLERSYDRRVEYAEAHPEAAVDLSREQYVTRFSAPLVSRYRSRAAVALGEIGTPAAVTALEGAAARSFGNVVDRAVERALRRARGADK